jgi:hypothetical protein
MPFFAWRVTFDYQFVTNRDYNRDRGPVSVIGTRLRAQFWVRPRDREAKHERGGRSS